MSDTMRAAASQFVQQRQEEMVVPGAALDRCAHAESARERTRRRRYRRCRPAPTRVSMIWKSSSQQDLARQSHLHLRYRAGRADPLAEWTPGYQTTQTRVADWDTDPYRGVIRDDRLYGLGAADMKGPDAALVYGLAAAVACFAGQLCGKVLLTLTADEEGGAQFGPRHLVEDLGLRADAALIAEPCGITRNWEMLPLIFARRLLLPLPNRWHANA